GEVDADRELAGAPLPDSLERRKLLHGQLHRSSGLAHRGLREHWQLLAHPALHLLVQAREDRDPDAAPRVLEDRLQHRLSLVDALLDLLLLERSEDAGDLDRLLETAGKVGDPSVGEALDLRGEARQRMAGDVEAERVFLALELLVERPLGE